MKKKFYSLKKDVDDPYKISPERAIEIIVDKRETDKNRIIKTLKEDPDIKILNGRWGPYISFKKLNFKIPKGSEPSSLTREDCLKIIESPQVKKKQRNNK